MGAERRTGSEPARRDPLGGRVRRALGRALGLAARARLAPAALILLLATPVVASAPSPGPGARFPSHAVAPSPAVRAQAGEAPAADELAAWIETASGDADIGLQELVDLGYALVGAQSLPAETRARAPSIGDALAAVRARLAARAAPPEIVGYFDWRVALALRDEGRLDDARRVLDAPLAASDPSNPYHAWISIELADLERAAGAWTRAFELLDRARAGLVLRADDPNLAVRGSAHATWLGVRGELYLDLGLPDLAAPLFDEMRRRSVEAGDPVLAWSALFHELELLLALEDYGALEARILALVDEPLYPTAEASDVARLAVYRALARVELERMGDAPRGEARRLVEAALAEPALGPFDRADVELAHGFLALDTGAWREAREAIERSRAVSGVPPPLLPGSSPDPAGSSPDPTDPPRQPGGPPVAAGSPLARDAIVLAALESRLAREAPPDERTLPPEVALARLEEAFEAFLLSWRAAPVRAGGVAFLHFGERHFVVGELVAALIAVRGEEAGARAALERLLLVQQRGSLALALGADDVGLARVLAAHARADAGTLVYQPGRDRSFVFALDARGIACFELPPAYALARARERLVREATRAARALAPDDDPALVAAAAETARAFLPAAARTRVAGWEAIELAGLDSFGYVPFEVLRVDGDEPLGRTRVVSYAPSLVARDALARRAGARAPAGAGGRELVVVAAPALSESCGERWRVPPIDLDARAVDSLAEGYPEPPLVLAGEAATLAAVAELCAPGGAASGARVLQVIAHGISDVTSERPAGLLLASRGAECDAWWADAIDRAAMPPLVVLTACGAARGPERRGDDGRSHLVGSLLLAGADCVVASHADLELATSLELLEPLHARLARGVAPAVALREARLELSRARPGSAPPLQHLLVHPYGRAGEPVIAPGAPGAREPASKVRLAVVVGAAALAAALVLLVVRRATKPITRRRPGSGS